MRPLRLQASAPLRLAADSRGGGRGQVRRAVASACGRQVSSIDPIEDDYYYDEDSDELARLNYKVAIKRLLLAFPELDPCPMLAHASQYDTRL